jgi:hypothetical protein
MPEDAADILLATPEDALASQDGRLVDVVDRLLDAGVCIRGELWLSVADVDLVFLGIDLVLCSHDRIRPNRGCA